MPSAPPESGQTATGRLRTTLGALRFPWPHASVLRVAFVFLGPALVAAPIQPRTRETLLQLGLLEVCGFSGFFGTTLLNDITDRELDKIAHPERPLARGTVRVGDAWALCGVLYAATLLTAGLLSPTLLALVVAWFIAPVCGHYLVFKRRRTRGGRVYSDLVTPLQFATAGTMVYPALGRFDIVAMCLLGATIYCGEAALNVLQAIGDCDGDAAFAVRTVAVRHGWVTATRLALALHVAMLPFAILWGAQASLGVVWAVITAVVWLYGGVLLARARHHREGVASAISATAIALQVVLAGAAVSRLVDLFW